MSKLRISMFRMVLELLRVDRFRWESRKHLGHWRNLAKVNIDWLAIFARYHRLSVSGQLKYSAESHANIVIDRGSMQQVNNSDRQVAIDWCHRVGVLETVSVNQSIAIDFIGFAQLVIWGGTSEYVGLWTDLTASNQSVRHSRSLGWSSSQ